MVKTANVRPERRIVSIDLPSVRLGLVSSVGRFELARRCKAVIYDDSLSEARAVNTYNIMPETPNLPS